METLRTSPDSWNDICSLQDDDIPLLRAALLIARDEYPQLDIGRYEAEAEEYEQQLRRDVDIKAPDHRRLAEVNRFLFEELGFSGNDDDYYDPRNSYLNEVFDRRLGIPISLGLIQLDIGHRLGMPLEGVSFPGHFLIRMPMEDGILVLDPYSGGRSIDVDELRQRVKPHIGGQDVDDADLLKLLAPASRRSILLRMLRNLKGLYNQQEAWDKALRCSDRMLSLDPSVDEEYRDRGQLYLKIGHFEAARTDLSHYLEHQSEADDADEIRNALIEASSSRISIN